jgi:phosphatidate cytidylyltransferase
MFLKRTITGAVLSAFIFSIIFVSHNGSFSFVMPLAVTLLAVMGILEFFYLMERKGVKTLKAFGVFAAGTYIWSLYLCSFSGKITADKDAMVVFCLFVGFFLVYFLDIYHKENNSALLDISVSFMGFFYVAWLLGFIIKINYFPNVEGRKFLALLIVTTKSTDIFAYLTGKSVGQIKLCPKISPNKTVEGALGGFAGAVLSAAAFRYFFMSELTTNQAVILGIMVGTIGQLGDLAESLLKRDAEVKDSSNQFPGLGGILDILDSILFTAPVMYFFMEAVL